MDDLSSSVRNIILANFPHLTPVERQDIDQEVKLKLWRMISNGKDITNLRSYLWRVVYTTTLDLLNERMPCDERDGQRPEERRRTLGPAFDNDPPEPETPESIAQKNEERMVVRSAIEALPLKRRVAVKMHFEGKSIKQTAEFLAWSPNKVRHLLYRGLNDLKKRLADKASWKKRD
jgi:RNA polymerase sigma-70 factor (ECF subfamily)